MRCSVMLEEDMDAVRGMFLRRTKKKLLCTPCLHQNWQIIIKCVTQNRWRRLQYRNSDEMIIVSEIVCVWGGGGGEIDYLRFEFDA